MQTGRLIQQIRLIKQSRPIKKRDDFGFGGLYSKNTHIQKIPQPDLLFDLIGIDIDTQQFRTNYRLERAFAGTIGTGKHTQTRERTHFSTRFSPTLTAVGGVIAFTIFRVPSGKSS